MYSIEITWDKDNEPGILQIEGNPDLHASAQRLANAAVTLLMETGLDEKTAQKRLLSSILQAVAEV